MDLRESVDKYVVKKLKGYKPEKIRAPKVIHDTILGSNLFDAHEIAVLDLPIVQRLRRISQVDVVSLVFPSGNHNRFEHTLGVTIIVDKLLNALFDRFMRDKNMERYGVLDKHLPEFYLEHARMAAILHDCGHGPFSHMSEDFMKLCDDYKAARKSEQILPDKPHEALSYLIVTSNSFKKFFHKHINLQYEKNIDLDIVGGLIIGFTQDPDIKFLADSISGAFDADKLDYMQRDSHFTGIKLVLDLPRLFYNIQLIKDDDKRIRLSVDLSGVAPLEQIVFNKMMLISTVYHHHKVRASECLFKSIIEEVLQTGNRVRRLKLNKASDFLYLTDDDIYGLSLHRNKLIADLAYRLKNRILPKRSLVIGPKTIEDRTTLGIITQHRENPEVIRALREAISDETKNMGDPVPVQSIWIDIPGEPKFTEGSQWPIKLFREDKEFIRMDDVFPVSGWTKAFTENKWKAHVFSYPENKRLIVSKAAQKVFESMGVKMNTTAEVLCKMEENGADQLRQKRSPKKSP